LKPEQRGLLAKPNLRASLAQAGLEVADRGEGYETIANEVHLLHGLGDPSKVHTIASGGFNEHFSGANAGTMFGSGIYMAEDAGKCDQYCRPVSNELMWDSPSCLSKLLGSGTHDLRGKELRFIFVCRTLLGCIVQVGSDREHRLGTQEPVFAPGINKRELALIPDYIINTPTHYHSELAEICPGPHVAPDTHTEALGNSLRFREFIAFRNTLIYPEFLVAYTREAQR